jgi:hypothetical protein
MNVKEMNQPERLSLYDSLKLSTGHFRQNQEII